MACPSCGKAYQVFATPATSMQAMGAPAGTVPNYLVQSILVTLCCCLPFGVVAVVYAAQVNSKLAGGDIAGARDASDKAKMWSWIGFGIGLLITLAYIGLMATGAINSR
jgi:uncharacterized membrane protein YphA (DoxX/SURF4 family)